MTSTPPDSAQTQTQTLSPAFGLAVLHSRFAPFAEAEKDDGPLFVAPVNLVIHQDDCAFVRATLELGKPTRLPCVVDFIWVLLHADDEAAALYRDITPGARSLPWYAAADAGVVEWGKGPHDVAEGRPSPNALTAAVGEAKDPSICRRGLGDEDVRFIAAALSAAAIADPRKRPLFDLAVAEFGWAEPAAEAEGEGEPTEGQEDGSGDAGSLRRAREWLNALFDAGSLLTAEHVRIMAANVNPFVPISEADDLWVCAAAALWSDAPPAARRLLCALDSAAARRFCVRVQED